MIRRRGSGIAASAETPGSRPLCSAQARAISTAALTTATVMPKRVLTVAATRKVSIARKPMIGPFMPQPLPTAAAPISTRPAAQTSTTLASPRSRCQRQADRLYSAVSRQPASSGMRTAPGRATLVASSTTAMLQTSATVPNR
ncbi:MAG: hypothetical protein QM722_06205 [Piscinibacter sp.]